ncbi:MAG: hypothetical protein LUF92_03810 [Clostridiales bacterium]|nr:hypothetical protein [Clostridiales bacterium]
MGVTAFLLAGMPSTSLRIHAAAIQTSSDEKITVSQTVSVVEVDDTSTKVNGQQYINEEGDQVAGTFPTDMAEHPVTAYSLTYDMVKVYKVSDQAEDIGQVNIGKIVLNES